MTLLEARSTTFSGALLWDLDGTILSTAKAGRIALRGAVLEIVGKDADYADLQTAGLTDAEVTASVLRSVGVLPTPELLARVAEEYERRLPDALLLRQGFVLPGVREALDGLAARRRVVSLLTTGNTRAGANAKLARYGIADRFPYGGAFCEGDLSRSDIVARAVVLATRLLDGAHGAQLVLIGDTPLDVACAQQAGIRAIGVATGSHSAEQLSLAGAWLVLDRIPDSVELEGLVLEGR